MASFEYNGTPGKPALIDSPPVKPPSPIKVEERLNHPEWRQVDYPGVNYVGADDANVEHMSPGLVEDVSERVFLLNINLVELVSGEPKRAYGQVAFLLPEDDGEQREDTELNPRSVTELNPRLVTAKHNVVVGGEYRYLYSEAAFGSNHKVIDFPEACGKKAEELKPTPLRGASEFTVRQDEWPEGIDVEWGEVAGGTLPDIVTQERCFTKVRKGFKLEKGQRVGIAVAMPPDESLYPSLRKAYPHLAEDTLRAIFGRVKDRRANIYAGEIKYIGENHIEYDFNSFEGCSGAIVFLLDQGQPDSVTAADYGKAIAVHAGAHPNKHLKHNLGFLVHTTSAPAEK